MPKGIHLVQRESFPVLKLNLSEQFETSKKNDEWTFPIFYYVRAYFWPSVYPYMIKISVTWEAALVYFPDTFSNRYDEHFCYNSEKTPQSSKNLIAWETNGLKLLLVFICIYSQW